MQFILTIQLGNEAMRTSEDINQALLRIAERGIDPSGGKIRDANGNTVGEYRTEA